MKLTKFLPKTTFRQILSIIFIVVFLDQLTKYLIHVNFFYGERLEIIKGFFNIVYARNYGAAFSFLSTSPEWFRKPFFIILPLFAIVLVAFFIKKTIKKQPKEALILSLILAGALGNLLDRFIYGFVIDFLDIYANGFFGGYHWPSFNVADISLTVAVFLYFIISVKKK